MGIGNLSDRNWHNYLPVFFGLLFYCLGVEIMLGGELMALTFKLYS
jgi:hypothetical protein